MATYIFCSEGKLARLRFSLCVANALKDEAPAMRANERAAWNWVVEWNRAVELVHCSSLLQDDIIDEAFERRGRICAHKVFGVEKVASLPLFLIGRG